jgi:hypothetical protein
MATNKAKRSLHLAQHQPKPQPQPARRSLNPQPATGLMPVKVHVYRVIAELNADLEKVIQDFDRVRSVSFFPAETLRSMHNALRRIRAEANRIFTQALHNRESANSEHFERLCIEQAKPQPDTGSAAGN